MFIHWILGDIFRKSKIRTKTKMHRPNQKTDSRPAITQTNEKNVTCPVKIDQVEADIQAYTRTDTHTHTHTYPHTHTHTHTHIHSDIFPKTMYFDFNHNASSRRKQKKIIKS